MTLQGHLTGLPGKVNSLHQGCRKLGSLRCKQVESYCSGESYPRSHTFRPEAWAAAILPQKGILSSAGTFTANGSCGEVVPFSCEARGFNQTPVRAAHIFSMFPQVSLSILPQFPCPSFLPHISIDDHWLISPH